MVEFIVRCSNQFSITELMRLTASKINTRSSTKPILPLYILVFSILWSAFSVPESVQVKFAPSPGIIGQGN